MQGFNLTTQQTTWITRFSLATTTTQLIRWGTAGLAFSSMTGGQSNVTLISGPVVSR